MECDVGADAMDEGPPEKRPKLTADIDISDTACSSQSVNKDDEINRSRNEKIQFLHRRLMVSLNDEIADSESCRFNTMKTILRAYVPKGIAEKCKTILDLLDELETRGKISAGNYEFLINNIFKPSSYQDEEVIKNILKTQSTIQTLQGQIHSGFGMSARSTTKSNTEYKQRKLNFKKDLLLFYDEVYSSVQLAPLLEENNTKFVDIYVPPQITKVEKGGTSTEVKSFKDIFICDEDDDAKHIYVSAIAGTGKTSFCQFVTLLWCSLQSAKYTAMKQRVENLKSLKFLDDYEVLKRFEFVFLVGLRYAQGIECVVDNMIFNQIVSSLSKSSMYDKAFVEAVLQSETCLVILDGLDEWTHPARASDYKCNRLRQEIPHCQVRNNCTILTTSRPWKLSECRLRKSEEDVCIEIKGINHCSRRRLAEHAIKCLNKETGRSLNADDFIQKLVEAKLDYNIYCFKPCCFTSNNPISIPIMFLQLVCLWYYDRSFGRSMCEIYGNMIDMLLGRTIEKMQSIASIDQESPYQLPNSFLSSRFCSNFRSTLFSLGKLAFKLLISEPSSWSLVFDQTVLQNCMFTEDDLTLSLSTGILSKSRCGNNTWLRKHAYNFMHKTYQEMFCALYMSVLKPNMLEYVDMIDCLHKVVKNTRHVTNISNVIVFICGMNPTLATHLSTFIAGAILPRDYMTDQLNVEIKTIQNMWYEGYRESLNNGLFHTNIVLEHAVIDPVSLVDVADDYQTDIKADYPLIFINRRRLKSFRCSSTCRISGIFPLLLHSEYTLQYLQLSCSCHHDHLSITDFNNFSSFCNLSVVRIHNLKFSGDLAFANTISLKQAYFQNMYLTGNLSFASCKKLELLHFNHVNLIGHLDLSMCSNLLHIVLNKDLNSGLIGTFRYVCLLQDFIPQTPQSKLLKLSGDLDLSSCSQLLSLEICRIDIEGKLNITTCSNLSMLCIRDEYEHRSMFHGPITEDNEHTCNKLRCEIKADNSYKNLTHVALRNVQIVHDKLDLSTCEHLQYVTMDSVLFLTPPDTFEMNDSVRTGGLNLSSCHSLTKVDIRNVRLSGNLNMSSCTKLLSVYLNSVAIAGDLNITGCKNLSKLNLIRLRVHGAFTGSLLGQHNPVNIGYDVYMLEVELSLGLDLSKCSNLLSLLISNTNINGNLDLSTCSKMTHLLIGCEQDDEDTFCFLDCQTTKINGDINLSSCTGLQEVWLGLKEISGYIDFTMCTMLSVVCINDATIQQELNLSACRTLTRVCLQNVHLLCKLDLSCCINLSYLYINQRTDFFTNANTVLSGGICLHSCNSLLEVYIRNTHLSGGIDLSSCTKLSNLDINCLEMTGIFEISACSRLSYVHINQEKPIHRRAKRMKVLDTVRLCSSSVISTLYIKYVEICGNLDFSSCDRLAQVKLDTVNIFGCLKLTSCFSLESVSITMSKVSEGIDLSSCTNLSQIHIDNLELHGVVKLSFCSNLTDVQVNKLIFGNYFIKTNYPISINIVGGLDLYSCANLSNVLLCGVAISGQLNFTSLTKMSTFCLKNIELHEALNISFTEKLVSLAIDNVRFKKTVGVSFHNRVDVTSCIELKDFKVNDFEESFECNLSNCHSLQKLHFQTVQLSIQPELTSCTGLLEVIFENVDEAYLPHLSPFIHLQTLAIAKIKLASKLDLCCNKGLLNLNLNNVELSCELDLSPCICLSDIVFENVQSHERLDLSPLSNLQYVCVKNVQPYCVINVSSCKHLSSLHLENVKVTGELDLKSSTRLFNLYIENVESCFTPDISNCNSLSTLHMSRINQVNDLPMSYCVIDVSSCKQLSSLHLANVKVTGELDLKSCTRLFNDLPMFTHLTSLYLGHVDLGARLDLASCQLYILHIENITVHGSEHITVQGFLCLPVTLSSLNIKSMKVPSSLDFSANTRLWDIHIENVELHGSLDLSSCTCLRNLYILNVNMTGILTFPMCMRAQNAQLHVENVKECV